MCWRDFAEGNHSTLSLLQPSGFSLISYFSTWYHIISTHSTYLLRGNPHAKEHSTDLIFRLHGSEHSSGDRTTTVPAVRKAVHHLWQQDRQYETAVGRRI